MDFYQSTQNEPHKLRRKLILEDFSDQIKPMIGNNPWSFLFVILIIIVQVTLAFTLQSSSWWMIFFSAYFLGAFLSHALLVFVHEATHNLIFKSHNLNRLVGILCDLALTMPSAMAFRRYHLLHHLHMGDYDQDADMGSRQEGRWVGKSAIRKALWMFGFGYSQAMRPLRMSVKLKMSDKWVLLNIIAVTVFVMVILYFFGFKSFIYLAFSTIFCLGLHPLGGRWIAEHYTKDPEQETFSYYGPINLIMFNIGYHTEHHDFMQVPWNRLPNIHSLAPKYYNSQKSHQSYTKVLFDFIFDKEMSAFSRVERKSATSTK